MSEEAVKFGLRQKVQLKPPAEKVHGVSVATVINNVDSTGEARVQLALPWLPGFLPWARLALPMAGMLRGTFFVPQIGDEVLVTFHQGDLREPFVIGTLWNTIDRPPSLAPTDAVTQRKIRTPLGHELSFDEATQSVTLTSNTLSKVTLDPLKAELSTPLATVSIGKDGDVTITAATKITLDAPVIEIKAKTVLTAQSGGTATLKAGGVCTLRGASVKIN
jgi:uncharacterized protein involved in type VI secretion and phage assembly